MRIDPEAYRQLKDAAARHGLSVSEYVRLIASLESLPAALKEQWDALWSQPRQDWPVDARVRLELLQRVVESLARAKGEIARWETVLQPLLSGIERMIGQGGADLIEAPQDSSDANA